MSRKFKHQLRYKKHLALYSKTENVHVVKISIGDHMKMTISFGFWRAYCRKSSTTFFPLRGWCNRVDDYTVTWNTAVSEHFINLVHCFNLYGHPVVLNWWQRFIFCVLDHEICPFISESPKYALHTKKYQHQCIPWPQKHPNSEFLFQLEDELLAIVWFGGHFEGHLELRKLLKGARTHLSRRKDQFSKSVYNTFWQILAEGKNECTIVFVQCPYNQNWTLACAPAHVSFS